MVLVIDDNPIKAEYRLAIVKQVFPGSDGKIRKVQIAYKHYKVGDTAIQYTGSTEQLCMRPVQRLALIVPVD